MRLTCSAVALPGDWLVEADRSAPDVAAADCSHCPFRAGRLDFHSVVPLPNAVGRAHGGSHFDNRTTRLPLAQAAGPPGDPAASDAGEGLDRGVGFQPHKE